MEFLFLVIFFLELWIKVVSNLKVVLPAVVGSTFMDEGEDEDRKFLFRNPYLKSIFIGCGQFYLIPIIMIIKMLTIKYGW